MIRQTDRLGLGVLAAGWLAFLFVGFPGQFTQDSVDQLLEARGRLLTDAHPPLMSFIWRYIDKVIPGMFGMFALQTSLLLAGLFLVFRRATTDRAAAAIALAVLWFPPVAAPMMVVWKDSLMAGACMLGFALLLDTRRQWFGLALIGIGCALRYNGLALALPIVVLLFNVGARRRYVMSVAAWVLIALLNVGINSALADRKMHFWSASLAPMDIAGTLCYDERRYSDAELEQLFAGTDLRIHDHIEARMCELFARSTHARLIHPDNGMWPLVDSGTVPTPEPRRAAIFRVWKDVVLSRPVAYLKYRLSVFYRSLSFHGKPWGMVTPRVPQVALNRPDKLAQLDISVRDSTIQAVWIGASTWIAESTPLFRPWLYLLVALLLLAVARRREIVALLLSGIALELSLLPLAVSPDYRYAHWLVLTTYVAGVLIVLDRRRPVTRSAPHR